MSACWQGLVATHDPRSVRVDLDAVTFIDAAGRALVRSMHAQGALLAAKDVMTRAIVAEIWQAPPASDRRLARN